MIHDNSTPETMGAYTLGRTLGEGAFGVVYEGRGAQGQKVAVKRLKAAHLHQQLRSRIEQEVAALATLGGPGIPRLVEAQLESPPFFIAMEYARGQNCFDYAHSNNLSIEGRLQLFLDICEVVDAAHKANVLHRDIKPSNVLVDCDGLPTVVDWGLAREIDRTATSQIGFAGTLTHAAPEILRGCQASVASDIFALGVLLVELCTGELPFPTQENATEQAAAILPIVRASDLHCDELAASMRSSNDGTTWRRLHQIWRKALEPNPSDRYTSVDQMMDDVRAVVGGRPPEHVDSDWSVLARAARRRAQRFGSSLATWGWIAALALAAVFAHRVYSEWREGRPVRYLDRSHPAYSAPWPKEPSVVAIYSRGDFGELHLKGLLGILHESGLHVVELGVPSKTLKEPGLDEDAFSKAVDEPLRRALMTNEVVAVVGPCHTNAVPRVLGIVQAVNPGIPVFIESPISREALGVSPESRQLSNLGPVYRISSGVEERALELKNKLQHYGERAVVVWEPSGHGRDLLGALRRTGALDGIRTSRADRWRAKPGDVAMYLGVRAGYDEVLRRRLPDTQVVSCMMGWRIDQMGEHANLFDISDLVPGSVSDNFLASEDDKERLASLCPSGVIEPSMRDEMFSFEAGLVLREAWTDALHNQTSSAAYGDALHGLTTAIERPSGFQGAEGTVRFSRGGGQDLEVQDKFGTWQRLTDGQWRPGSPR